MNQHEPRPKRDLKPKPPKWNSPIWYLPVMLLLLWFWQSTVSQLAYKTIPYSEFKDHLAHREVAECVVKDDAIEGKIQPGTEATPPVVTTTNPPAGQKAGNDKKEFYFRTVRVEDPNLVQELEEAKVKFHGARQGFFSQFLLAWILPIGVMILIWSFISRRIGNAGESILSFGRSKARLVAEKETGDRKSTRLNSSH